MRKKELSKIPIRYAELTDIKTVKRIAIADYFVIADTVKLNQSDILILNFFTREDLTEEYLRPIFRTFFTKDDYITQSLIAKNKWFTGRIEAVLNRYYWFNKTVSLNEETENQINRFFPCSGLEKSLAAVYYFQQNVLKQRLRKRHQKEMDSIDADMEQIVELPKDFKQWCDEQVLFHSRYIYYKKRNGDKPVNGYCTFCHKEVTICGPRHNQFGVCPSCGSNIQFKVEGRTKRIYDFGQAAFLQKTEDGFCIRYFKVGKHYTTDFKNPKMSIFESIRCMYTDSEERHYIWDNYRLTGEYRWCKDTKAYFLRNTVVYLPTISQSLGETKWKYCALEEYVQWKGSVGNLPRFLAMYVKFPFIEQLIKVKLLNFAESILDDYNGMYSWNYARDIPFVQAKETQLHKILGVNKAELKFMIEKNISKEEFVLFKTAQSKGIVITPKIFSIFLKYENFSIEILDYLKYTTIYKLDKYLVVKSKEEKIEVKTAWILWRDYVKACQGFKYDLKNSFILFPKHLKKAHDHMMEQMELKRKKEIQLRKKILKRKYKASLPRWKKMYQWENNKFVIRVPENQEAFIQESHALHHCVGTQDYFEEMANGKTIILFLRKKEDKDTPFYTLELKNQNIVQCFGKNHAASTTEIEIVLRQFLKQCVQAMETVAV